VEELLERVRPHLESVAQRGAETGDAGESVSDLVQEAWLRAWERLDQFRGGGGDQESLARFCSWAGQILRNTTLHAHRRRSALKRKDPGRVVLRIRPTSKSASAASGVEPVDHGPTPSVRLRETERIARVRGALARLEDGLSRDLLRLRFFEGMSLRRAATQVGLTYDQARDRFQKALAKVGRELCDID